MSWQASDHVRKLRDVSAMEKAVLYSLADRHNTDDQGCWPRIPLIAKDAGMSERSVQRIMQALSKKGVIRISPRDRGDGSRSSNFYQFVGLDGGGDRLRGGGDTVSPGGDRLAPLESPIEPEAVVVTRGRKKYEDLVRDTQTLSGVYTNKYWTQELSDDWDANTDPEDVKDAVTWVAKAMGVTGPMTLPTPTYLPALSRFGSYVRFHKTRPDASAVIKALPDKDRVRERVLYGIAKQVGGLIGELR